MSSLRLEGLARSYGGIPAVDGIDLEVGEGRFVSLVGPSGCGKTTVLRMIAGLIAPDRGRIFLGGEDITAMPVHRRNLGVVFQSYALFPHLSVFDNVAFPLRQRQLPPGEVRRRAEGALARVRLDPMAHRRPRELSGGQQQRTALARALVFEPRLLLLDEPFSNLDALLRDEMRVEVKRLQRELGITTLFVTHDQGEALAMADQVAVMNRGRLEQIAPPETLYRQPASAFVAHFIGRANLLPGSVTSVSPEATAVRLDCGVPVRSAPASFPAGTAVRVVVRQESIRLVAAREAGKAALVAPPDDSSGCGGPVAASANTLAATVVVSSFTGALTQVVLRLDAGGELLASVAAPAGAPAPGTRVHAEFDPADTRLVAPDPA